MQPQMFDYILMHKQNIYPLQTIYELLSIVTKNSILDVSGVLG